MTNLEKLRTIVLAPWIFRGTELIGKPRKIGGNQFRHNMATMSILIDYKYVDPILLKASVIHDLLEEIPETKLNTLLNIDSDSYMVVKLVQEVTRKRHETKADYLARLLESGTYKAKILKCADRISNLTDLHLGIFSKVKIKQYLDETEKYILPLADEVNKDMHTELNDLIKVRNDKL
jgi:hypothetical protein